MGTIGTVPGECLARLAADLFHKIQKGELSLDELSLFVQRKNPFAWERNEHGHIVLTFVGLNLTGAQEIERLEGLKYRIGNLAKSCLLSTKADGYDKKHRLVAGQGYKVALMPGKEIAKDAQRTTANLRNHGMEHFGYGKPLAGLAPRVREAFSDKQMEELSVWYTVCLHDPIKDSDGNPVVLSASRRGGGRGLGARWDGPDFQWDDNGLFAFPVLAST